MKKDLKPIAPKLSINDLKARYYDQLVQLHAQQNIVKQMQQNLDRINDAIVKNSGQQMPESQTVGHKSSDKKENEKSASKMVEKKTNSKFEKKVNA